ncbi:hypothetical protein BOO69_18720 (plasmid) [Sulfitobacter alexandrii]|uniref:HTH gntR-type domain-containing protein n=1 Tax=Sulfitobacter alexandrii TaxID=1917485 RepID=A0A1J0WN20_9RHOB|nr:hypothetical protein BOO69_18720 [Sulfitobacter alexandrii]
MVDRGDTLTDKVYAELRRALLTGVWEPGRKLTARSLSRELNVSLTPVREAMLKLANEGGLALSETRAFSVPELSRGDYDEVVAIRLALEPMAAEKAAAVITPETVDRLDRINDEMKALIEAERFGEALQKDTGFHRTIYALAGSAMLDGMIDQLWLRVGPTRNLLSHTFRQRLIGYQNHETIIAALRKADPAAAREAIHRDIAEGAKSLREKLAP